MSSKNDFLSLPPRRPRRPLDPSRLRRASSLSESQHSACSSTLLQPIASSSQKTLSAPPFRVDFDKEDLTHADDTDKRSESSITLFSRCISPSPSRNQGQDDHGHSCSESPPPLAASLVAPPLCSYPLYEPGQRIAQRIRTLRARTGAVIMSLPATVEDFDNLNFDDEPVYKLSIDSSSKLRRVQGVGNLRAVFRNHEPEPAPLASSSSMEFSKASHELGFLAPPPRAMSSLSSHASLSTLVDARHLHAQRSGDLKTLCNATLSSLSILSPSVTKFQFHSSLSSHTFSPTDIPSSILPTVGSVHNSSIPRPNHHIRSALTHTENVHNSPRSRQRVWSCAKISQSAVKRAARRGHHPSKSRVLSNPVVPLNLFA